MFLCVSLCLSSVLSTLLCALGCNIRTWLSALSAPLSVSPGLIGSITLTCRPADSLAGPGTRQSLPPPPPVPGSLLSPLYRSGPFSHHSFFFPRLRLDLSPLGLILSNKLKCFWSKMTCCVRLMDIRAGQLV